MPWLLFKKLCWGPPSRRAVRCMLHNLKYALTFFRFSNMDYMVLSTLGLYACDITDLVISYDISCSFRKNFISRAERYPGFVHLNIQDLKITWAIPRFHIRAHGPRCQSTYNFAYICGSARTHGKVVETGWADLNPCVLSTREMSEPSWHETLDDMMGAINWRKVENMGLSAQRRCPQRLISCLRSVDAVGTH